MKERAMKAIVVDQPGGVETLVVREVPEPEAGPDEVLIETAYCGCNWADLQRRQGTYPHPVDYPHIMGREVSGTVAALGANTSGLTIGDRVIAIPSSGGYAERCISPARLVSHLPDAVPFDIGGAFQVQALTAYHMLHTLRRTEPGETVLLHAAAGGVGLFAIQLAVKAGATVIGTVGTKGKEAKALDYGAARVVNLNEDDFVAVALEMTDGKGVDLALDSLGAATLDRTFDAVRALGHIINIGEAEGTPYPNIRERMLPHSHTFTRFSLGNIMDRPDLWRRGIDYILAALEEGWLDVPIVDRIPFEDAAEAHRRLESRQVAGKLLLSFVD
jgi:NADPH2:quinone reductase